MPEKKDTNDKDAQLKELIQQSTAARCASIACEICGDPAMEEKLLGYVGLKIAAQIAVEFGIELQ